MSASVRTRIVKIGNSQGIRIPKMLLDQSGLGTEVEVTLEENQLVIRSARPPRSGWDEAYAAMAERGDDALVDADAPSATAWDQDQWQW